MHTGLDGERVQN